MSVNKDDQAYMDELAAATTLRPRLAAYALLWGILGFFVAVSIWASLAQVDERVRGQGQVAPSSDLQVVQSLEGGIVREILVREGDTVARDQVLLRIDDIQFASEGRGIEAQMASLRATQARLRAETGGQTALALPEDIAATYPDIAMNEEKLFRSRAQELQSAIGIIRDEVREAEANLSEVRANIAKYSKSKELLQKELAITRRLVEKKAQPEIEQLRLERELNEASGNLSTVVQAQESLNARLSGARKREEERISAFRSQALGELNEVEAKIAAIGENLKSVQDKVNRTELRAPAGGVIHKLHVKTVGGVLQPAQKVAEIVPADDDLLIRARVSPADVGFLRAGMPVRVSLTAYDPQVYGTLDGVLERIGADTVKDGEGNVFFEVDVRTARDSLGEGMPVVAGMVADIDVITGKRSIMSYLLRPVLRAGDRALTEK